jgi:hypothetical protein
LIAIDCGGDGRQKSTSLRNIYRGFAGFIAQDLVVFPTIGFSTQRSTSATKTV